jgi:hypothetical protein
MCTLFLLGGVGVLGTANVTLADPIATEAVSSNLDDFLVYANEAVDLRDRASATGNVGSNTTVQVGADGKVVGNIQSRSGVTLRSRARIEGDVTTGGSVVKQGGVVITGVVTANASVPSIAIPTQTVSPGTADVILWSGQTRVLAPGAYDEIHVYSGATLTLQAGVYAARLFVVEADGNLKLDVTGGNISIGVSANMSVGDRVKMAFVGTGNASQVSIYSNQTSMFRIGTNVVFIGTVTAPLAEVSVASRVVTHGLLRGRRVTVDTDSQLSAQ